MQKRELVAAVPMPAMLSRLLTSPKPLRLIPYTPVLRNN